MEQHEETASFSAPPYVSFANFESSLQRLFIAGIPGNLRVYELASSANIRAQLIPAYRGLGLIDDDFAPTKRLADLVTAYDSEQYPAQWSKLLKERFPDIASLDLLTATPGTLSKAFARRGISPDVARKAQRFYLNAAQRAGLSIGSKLRFGRRLSGAPAKRRRPNDASLMLDAARHRREIIQKLPEFNEAWSDKVKIAWLAAVKG